MGHGQEAGHWFALAHELAVTGRYRNLAEVEAALQAKEPDAILPSNKAARSLINEACFRARWAKGGDA